MLKEKTNMIDYMMICICKFAERHFLMLDDAYIYLRNYKGLDFLLEIYDEKYLMPFEDAVDDMEIICMQNGGKEYHIF